MSLSEARYHDLVDAAQQLIEDAFDDSGLDVDLENAGGVLTVRFANGSQLIVSRQPAMRPRSTTAPSPRRPTNAPARMTSRPRTTTSRTAPRTGRPS